MSSKDTVWEGERNELDDIGEVVRIRLSIIGLSGKQSVLFEPREEFGGAASADSICWLSSKMNAKLCKKDSMD
jgi:hypothetical protein